MHNRNFSLSLPELRIACKLSPTVQSIFKYRDERRIRLKGFGNLLYFFASVIRQWPKNRFFHFALDKIDRSNAQIGNQEFCFLVQISLNFATRTPCR